jgi:hypothetical protein
MATLADLKNRLLYTANKLHAGQTATAEVGDKAETAITSEIANLAKRGVINYANVTDMPEEDEEAIVILSAWRARFALTMSVERIAFLREANAEAWRELCANNETPYDGEPTEAEYF